MDSSGSHYDNDDSDDDGDGDSDGASDSGLDAGSKLCLSLMRCVPQGSVGVAR